MSLLLKFRHKSPYYHPQSILSTSSIFSYRFLSSGESSDEAFPDEPTSAYYDKQVYKAGRDGDLELVHDLLNKRVRDGCFNTAKTFLFLTQKESSLSILDPLIHTISRLDKGLPRKQAFDLLIARLSKLGKTDDALRIIHTMADAGTGDCKLNAPTFHPVLNAMARKGDMDGAWRLLAQMKLAGLSPDITAYNYLLTSYCSRGMLEEATAVVEKMEEEGLGADGRTFDALILGACKVGNVDGALLLLRTMMAYGIHVMYSTHCNVINGMLRLRYFDQAVRFVMACRGTDLKLDEASFGTLAHKLVNLRKTDEAMLILGEMKKLGLAMGPKLTLFYEANINKTLI